MSFYNREEKTTEELRCEIQDECNANAIRRRYSGITDASLSNFNNAKKRFEEA